MDPVDVVRRLGGVAASGEIIGVSTRAQLRTAVKRGRLVRLRHDTYALGDLDSARAEAVAAGGVLSHLSAAQWWGWKVKFPPTRTHVTVPANRRRPAGNLAVHFAQLAEKEIHRDVTDQARTVIDCARTLPFDEALAVADSALRSGDIDRTDLENALSGCPRTGRRRAERVVECADARADNPFESVLRAIASDVAGLEVEPQGEVPGVGWVDLLDRRRGIVIEAESFEFHAGRDAMRRDVQRYTACTRLGLVVVRFLWEEVMFRPEHVKAGLVDVTTRAEVQAFESLRGGKMLELPTWWST